jgi:hypothetical protein
MSRTFSRWPAYGGLAIGLRAQLVRFSAKSIMTWRSSKAFRPLENEVFPGDVE